MRFLVAILFLLICFVSCDRISEKKEGEKSTVISSGVVTDCDYFVKVISVSDGDTFKGKTKSGKIFRFRVYGIDAPESDQVFGQKSRAYLNAMIYGKTVGIKVQKKNDQYGRPVVWAYTPEGKDISYEMLNAGMAWHYKRFNSSPEYAACEKKARKKHLGLWADNNPQEPWVYRREKRQKNKH
jgi:endonuclease YncB( thermonuclease family)